jgi:hypothetical protein
MKWGLVKTALMAATGFGYGLVLALIGLIGAGAGHGTYVLLGMYASPLSLMQHIALAVFGLPVLWCLISALLAGTTKRGWMIAFLVAMLAHYVSLPWVLKEGETFGDWEYAAKIWGFVLVGIGVYVVGQVIIWVVFLAELFTARMPPR